jgi:hypothetical protein
MFLKKIPTDSKIVLSIVFGSLIGGLYNIIIRKNTNNYNKSLSTVIFTSE